tara:strand:- start:308 stop:673 length:366 start_codon:yes stop_codon:yes gene_type:complete
MKDISKNVYWERNIKTRRNPNIASQVISKTTTDNFPHGAVTVRYNQITSSRPSASVYFYGKSYNNGGVLSDWPSSKLIVYISPATNGGYHYNYNGYSKSDMFSLRDVTDYCEYIQSEMENM